MAKPDLYPPDKHQSVRLLLFIANGLQSRPSRPGDAPSDLLPKPQLVLAGLPRCPGPIRSRLLSIANSRRSKRTPVLVPLSAFQREPVAELWSRLPRDLAPLLSLPG
jgi:hypothetical protein